jgi:Na+/melibiose symporter-like transporter
VTALSRRAVTLYAVAAAPVAILGLPLSVFLPPFVSTGGAIAVGLVGVLFMLATLWDGFIDPAIGRLIDRRNAHGTPHRRWIWLSIVPMTAALSLVVAQGDALAFLPLLALLILFTSSYSFYDVGHLAWGSALADDAGQSSRLFGAREWAGKIGVLLAFAVPAAVQAFVPDLDHGGRVLAYAALAVLLLPLALWATTGLPVPATTPQVALDWRAEWRVTLGFPALLLLIAAQAMNAFGLGAITSIFVFFADGVLGLASAAPLLLLISFIGAGLTTPLWTRLAIRIGKPRGMLVMALWLVAVMAFASVLPRGNFPLAALFVFILGSGFVGLLFIYGIAADLTVADRERCGRDRTAFVFSLVNVAQKAGTALGIGFSYIALDLFAFDPGNPAASATPLRAIYVGVPVVAWLGVAAAVYRLSADPAARRIPPR